MERILDSRSLYGSYLELKFRKLEEFLQLTERLQDTVNQDDLDGTTEHLANRNRCIQEIDRIDGMINDLLYRGKTPGDRQAAPPGFRKLAAQMVSMGQKALEMNRRIEARMSSGCEELKSHVLSLLAGGKSRKAAGVYRAGERSSRFLDVKG